ncbi:hypothetical protein VTK26DRAFT_6811 [Humicola hyalothermophila]
MPSEQQLAASTMSQTIPTKVGSPQTQESPLKRRRAGITLAQKQALIENLQLEITERARKLRANYSIHAQSLRTRIEIRVNRIPMSLRKLTMGELWEKYMAGELVKPSASTNSLKGPPVPAKDKSVSRPPITRGPGATAVPSARPVKRRSHEMTGGDKENELETPQKRVRANTTASLSRNPVQALSSTTSNSRIAPRVAATPARSGIARPAVASGRAVAASNALNNTVDKSRSTTRPATATTTLASTARPATATAASTSTTATRKTAATANPSANVTSTASSAAAAAAAAAARRKRGATVTAAGPPTLQHRPQPPPRPATRTAQRRASGNSESSEDSTSTVIRKRPVTAPSGPAPASTATTTTSSKRTAVGTAKKVPAAGVGSTRKAPAASAATGAAAAGGGAGSKAGPGRVLRKRP